MKPYVKCTGTKTRYEEKQAIKRSMSSYKNKARTGIVIIIKIMSERYNNE